MKTHSSLLVLCSLLLSFTFGYAQSPQLSPDSLLLRVWQQEQLFPREKIYTLTDRPAYVPGDTIWFRSFLVNSSRMQENASSRYVYAELISPADTLIHRVKIGCDPKGAFYGYLPIPPQIPFGNYLFRCYTRHSAQFEEKGFSLREISICKPGDAPLPAKRTDTDFHVGFYPEGGDLIAGQLCRIAFETETKSGMPVGMQGWVVSEKKDTLCAFQARHQGMGDFSFIPQAGVTYYAHCSTSLGHRRFKLPPASEEACALKVERHQRTIFLSILRGTRLPKSDFQLLAVARDKPIYAQNWGEGHYVSFPDTLFPSGVVHFFLLQEGRICSRRSLFVYLQDPPCLQLHDSSDGIFHRRQKMEYELSLTDSQGKPLNGSAAVSITDARDLVPDSLQTIVSELLLSSDIQGKIIHPAWYFTHPHPDEAAYALDILLRIRVWCRYDFSNVLQAQYEEPEQKPETSLSIRGKATSQIWRKPIPGVTINLHITEANDFQSCQTDDKGQFEFNGFEFPDSTRYLLSAWRKNGRKDLVLQVDSMTYLPLKDDYIRRIPQPVSFDSKVSVNYVEKAIRNISTDKDMRNYLLGEVEVTAYKPRTYLTSYEIAADKVVREKEIQRSGIQDLGKLIFATTGVDFFNFRGRAIANTSDPEKIRDAVLLDRILVLDEVKIEDVMTVKWLLEGGLSKDDIQQIEVLKGAAKCSGYFRSNYSLIVSITTKRGGRGANYYDTNFAYLMPLGPQRPAAFYSPHYPQEGSDLPDLRTTILWQPQVLFKDGQAKVSFYTADTPSAYTFLLEGITEKGEPFRKQQTLFPL